MKKLLLPLLFVLAVTASFGATCTAGYVTTSSYYGGFSCEINNISFSNFLYGGTGVASTIAGPGVITPTSTTIYVTPILTTGLEGFTFQFGLNATSGQTGDLSIKYTETALSGYLYGVQLSNVNASATPGTGANVTVSEAVTPNLGGTLNLSYNNPAAGGYFYTNGDSTGSNTGAIGIFGGGVTSATISKDIYVDGGTVGAGGVAHISLLDNGNGVPEPMTMSLLGIGLLGLGFFGRRVRK